MTRRWINSVFAVLGIHSLIFCYLIFTSAGKIWFAGFFLSLIVLILILSVRMYEKLTSPYSLATMFVDGLKQEKFGPALPHVAEPDADQLLNSLNGLSEDLKEKHETIKKLENLRIEFVANVSHELKTPLTSIRGYTETLLGGAYKDSDACVKFLKRIDENGQRLSALISDLLDLSRLEAFPDILEWQTFPAQNISEKLEGMFFPALTNTKQKMFIKFSDTIIEGDKKKLEQVFSNLIDNAIRYTPEGTLIEFKQRREGKDFIYEVIDNGPGIPTEHLPRIFERFYRVDQARSRDTGGTGLGLSIVKHIVLAHGGQIHVESTEGSGTKFTMRIPARIL